MESPSNSLNLNSLLLFASPSFPAASVLGANLGSFGAILKSYFVVGKDGLLHSTSVCLRFLSNSRGSREGNAVERKSPCSHQEKGRLLESIAQNSEGHTSCGRTK